MGTNYYHRTNICDECDRYDETHIGMSMNSFEAVIEWPDEPPYGPVITVASWAQWKERLLAGGQVWNEYGEFFTPGEFIAQVERIVSPESGARQYKWVVDNMPALASNEPSIGKYWLDADGFSFYGGEFS